MAELRRENAQLRAAMTSRALIEQAKGMLMLGYGLDAEQAFAVLSRWSQADQVKVRVLAERLTEDATTSLGVQSPNGTRPDSGAGKPARRVRPRPPAVAPLESLAGG